MAETTFPFWGLVAYSFVMFVVGLVIGFFVGGAGQADALRQRLRSAHKAHESERQEWTRERERLLGDYGQLVNALRERAARRRAGQPEEPGAPSPSA